MTDTFFITYFANKHKKFITRKAQYNKPDGTRENLLYLKMETLV